MIWNIYFAFFVIITKYVFPIYGKGGKLSPLLNLAIRTVTKCGRGGTDENALYKSFPDLVKLTRRTITADHLSTAKYDIFKSTHLLRESRYARQIETA